MNFNSINFFLIHAGAESSHLSKNLGFHFTFLSLRENQPHGNDHVIPFLNSVIIFPLSIAGVLQNYQFHSINRNIVIFIWLV